MLKELIMVKFDSGELEKRAEEALRSCLDKVPFLKFKNITKEPERENMRPDFLAKLALPDGEQVLVVEIKSNGQPRLAREAVNQLLRYRDLFPGSYGVFVAPYISEKAAEICEKEEIGYVDLSGNCRLSFGQVYVEQQGKPNLFAEKRDLRSLYSPKAERVLRVLLINPKRPWKTKDLAAEAEVSLGQVSNVKKLLSDRERIRTERDGFVLSMPGELLEEWSEIYSFRKNQVRDFYTLKSVVEIEANLAEVCKKENVNYALTGFSAAARLAPAVRYQRAMAYVMEAQDRVASLLGLKEVTSGANLSLLAPYDEGIFYGATEFDGIKVASPIQIYLDLVSFRGRGEEAADAILEEVIRPQW
jgi:hypothetical protein